MEARRLETNLVRYPGRPDLAAAEVSDALLNSLHHKYPLVACHPLLEQRTRVCMLDNLLA